MSQVERVNHRGGVLRQRRRHLLWKIPGGRTLKGKINFSVEIADSILVLKTTEKSAGEISLIQLNETDKVPPLHLLTMMSDTSCSIVPLQIC